MTHKFPPFENWEELQAARIEAGFEREDEPSGDKLPAQLRLATECLSVFHTYLVSCATLLLSSIARDDHKKRPKFQASFTLICGMVTDVASIEALTSLGFDIQAKTIVRALREKLDYLIAVQLDRSFAVAFVAAQSSDEANAFWHRNVAKGKLFKNVARRLSHYSADGASPIDKLWMQERRAFDRWLGEAVHPSHTMGLLSVFPQLALDADTTSSNHEILGSPSNFSVPTISSAMALTYELIYLVRARLPIIHDHALNISRGSSDLLQIFECSEKFLVHCTANSSIDPNLDMFKLHMYLSGYMLQPLDREIDHREYELEMLDVLVSVLQSGKQRLEEILRDHENH